MICFRCRLELFPEPELLGEDTKHWVDKSWGEWTCPTPTGIPGVVEHGITAHSPAYEISGELLDFIVEAVGELVEVLDRIGDDQTEQYAQLAEIISTGTKLVEP